MLLPSALPCDVVRPPLPRSRFSSSSTSSARLFSTPPPSDNDVASHLNSGLHNTCRALQTLLGTQKPATAIIAKPAPLLSPIALAPRIKVSKKSSKAKPAPPPRGIHKRRRAVADDGREDAAPQFSTPKRMRLAPPDLPLGMRRADFEGLEEGRWSKLELEEASSLVVDTGADQAGMEWSVEDDRLLVELVLEKLKLTKDDWDACARKLGKESGSLGMRWRALVGGGNVGLRRGRNSCRMRIDCSWR